MRSAIPDLPVSVAALPFLFMRDRSDDADWAVRSALAAAMAAERAVTDRRNKRGRLAYLLCELGYQLARRGADRDARLTLPRGEIASALGTSLCKVKRILALLSLSRVIETDGDKVRVLDWRRLAGIAHFELKRLGVRDEEEEASPAGEEAPEPYPRTAAGDPACFV